MKREQSGVIDIPMLAFLWFEDEWSAENMRVKRPPWCVRCGRHHQGVCR